MKNEGRGQGRSGDGSSSGASSKNAPDVVLLHGLGRTWLSMTPVHAYLCHHGFRVANLGYPSRKFSVESLVARRIGPRLEELLSDRPLHFVTHSMGGILLRRFLQDRDLPPGSRVVMLAPPNRGSELVDRLQRLALFRWWNGPAGLQLGAGPDSLPNRLGPIRAEVGVISGNRCLNPIFGRIIPGPSDGKVSVERARLPEMTDFLVLPVSHTFAMFRRPVLAQVLHFLRHGRFDRSSVGG
ncbi:MAG: esterase/lipase family protein [Desulfococcaceae bacterium]